MGNEQKGPDYHDDSTLEDQSSPIEAGLSLRGKRIVVFGLQGGGKSYWAKYVALHYDSLVFDIHSEYRSDFYYVIRPQSKQQGTALDAEFQLGMDQYIFSKKPLIDKGNGIKVMPNMLVIDEANQYFPPKPHPLHPAMARLNDFNRHMGLAFMCVARRPTQLHSDLVELAHYVIIFKLTGINDMKRFRDMYPGLDAAVFGLKDHEFIVYEPGKRFYKCAPIPIS